jgi:NADH:ubiquinone oxidoreductase subunit 6 (subunit J)
MYSILSLVSCIFFSTLILFLFGIEFMSFVYLVVYIGAIAILFLFMVMMLNTNSVNSIQHHISILDLFLYICIFFKTLYISFFINTNIFNFYLDDLKSKPVANNLIDIYSNTEQFNKEVYEFYYLYFLDGNGFSGYLNGILFQSDS